MASLDQPASFLLSWRLDSGCLSGHLKHDITVEGNSAFSNVTLLAFLFTVAASPPFFNPPFVVEPVARVRLTDGID